MMKTLTHIIITMFFSAGFFVSQASAITWQECVSVALKKNPSLEIARQKVIQRKSDTGIATSPMLPQASAAVNAGSGKSKISNQDRSTALSTTTEDDISYSLSVRQLIFDGLKTPNSAQAAKSAADASRYEYIVTESNVRLYLRQAFVRLLAAQENLSISKKILQRREENFKLVSIRYDAGKEHKGSVLKARANLSLAQAEFSRAMRNINLARIQLTSIMGITDDPSIVAQGDISTPHNEPGTPDFNTIAASSPLLQQMMELKKAAVYSSRSYKGEFFPSIYGYMTGGGSNNSSKQSRDSWSAGLEMSYPLSDGGQRYHNARKADSKIKEAQEEVNQTRLDILYTLSEKWYALQSAFDDIEVYRQYLEAAQERSKIAEAQYSIGQILFNNWTIIEDELVTAQKNYLSARSTALYAEAEWVQAQGGTFSHDIK